eukprot:1196304-Prorocentrum_minimum.AAC.10
MRVRLFVRLFAHLPYQPRLPTPHGSSPRQSRHIPPWMCSESSASDFTLLIVTSVLSGFRFRVAPAGFVQSHYWDVGFLRYFVFKQIPNFALAGPMLALSASGIWSYAAYDPARFASFGLREGPEKLAAQRQAGGAKSAGGKSMYSALDGGRVVGYFRADVLVYVFQWAAMVLVATFVMNVQVATRFLASGCPPLYWYAAHLCHTQPFAGRAIWAYFLGYLVVGTMLFVNFYPWT